jgi:ubiquitin-protein ligase
MTELPASENLFGDKGNQATLLQSREYQIMFEYETLVHYLPKGIFVMPDIRSIHVWHGILIVNSGAYAGNVLKFTIDIPQNYPLVSPKVFFNTQVFHPLIDSATGELNLQPKFPVWRAKRDFLFMVLMYIKACFLQLELWTERNSKNKEAFLICKNESLLKEKQAEVSKVPDRKSSGIIHKFDVNEKEDEQSSLVLKMFRNIRSEENVKEFLEWFHSRYRVSD